MAQSRRRRRAAPAPEDVFVDALADMPAAYLDCREQHDWRTSSDFRLVDTTREDRQPRMGHEVFAERRKTCKRCGMTRTDTYAVNRRGGYTALSKIASSYDPPEGYYVSGIGGAGGMRDILLGVKFDQAMRNRK